MSGKQTSGWLAWIVFLGVLGALFVFTMQLWRRGPVSGGPSTVVEGDSGWPRTLVERFPDGREGRRLTLPAPPQRIVSLTLAVDEILMDLIGPARIVALSELAPKPGSLLADRVGAIEHFVGSDVESIIALQPDLCFLASYNRKETRSLLIDSGIPVFVFSSFHTFEDIRKSIHTVGRAVGAEDEAKRLVAEMDRKLEFVAQRIPAKTEWPSVLAYGQSGWVSGAGTTQSEIFESAGLSNAATELGITGHTQVSQEQVLAMDPDYFVVVTQSVLTPGEEAWLMENPALAPLRAIQEEHVLTVRESQLSSVSHHVADAVVVLARQVYPDKFPNDQP
jgi:iron complex transport system substrate-binding protein